MDYFSTSNKQLIQNILKVAQSGMYIMAGTMHFTHAKTFISLMPPMIPFHAACVYISGVIEICLGLSLWNPSIKKETGYGIIALLIGVFPANIWAYFDYKMINVMNNA